MMKNRIIIVGRPNVGKSTLFNRIIGRRKSIVYDLPGVTRDIIESEAEWKGKRFIVADTGGIFERGGELFKSIEEEVKKNLSDAKAILFVVDAKEGLTEADRYVAKMLYPYKEKVFLVVNKVDNEKLQRQAYDFYSLGFDRVFLVSAQHGRGVDELLSAVCDLLEDEPTKLEYEGIKVSFVGRPNVGKSSLINAILGSQRVLVSPIAGTTRDAVEIPFTYSDQKFVLIDTAGIRRRTKVEYGVEFFSVGRAIKAIELSDVSCLVLDMSEGITHQDQKIGGLIERRYKACVIVGNKFDLVKTDKNSALEYVKRQLSFLDYAPVVFTSALKGVGINELLHAVVLAYQDYTKEHKTSFINRAVQKVMGEKPPPVYKGKEVKVYYAFQEGTKPPTVVIITNYPEGWKESYKRFFVRKLREHLRIRHSPIKLIIRGREA
ncbi:ribosome biogenesis GTPase Der [Hydrogenobacter hydrogenophilus]|uniref:GTPase Der n=1 Tax=Hydrogenobacter hydrogenophilus TaxID=35835 RepID=A0A285NU28_9AQUI|nr:ribosome biogenesis GTPase Der [Hydrogenobacter hydrogenophilus]SNZ11161.1 GTP-binding protein [Hydrogenobacter hydrogenophilus]